MEQIAAYLEVIVSAAFAEAFAVYFLVGLIIFILGLALVVLYALSRLTGVRVAGTVVGAVQVEKRKTRVRDGGSVEKVKHTLFPVYEYIDVDGSTQRMQSSEGGTMTLKYSTGQEVNLIVRGNSEDGDIYDADEYGALYLALGMLLVGAGVMTWVGSAAAAFGVGVMALVCAVIGFFVNGLVKKFLGPKEPSKPTTRRETSDLHPIEFFQEQSSKIVS